MIRVRLNEINNTPDDTILIKEHISRFALIYHLINYVLQGGNLGHLRYIVSTMENFSLYYDDVSVL